MGKDLVVRNATYLDVHKGTYSSGNIIVLDGMISSVDTAAVVPAHCQDIDAQGLFVLPGLIDCHVHVTSPSANVALQTEWSPNYLAMSAAKIMSGMLDRGFTTVRDVAGADFGLHDAQAEGLLRGPRLLFGGKALSQTGGHGDLRSRGRESLGHHQCTTSATRIADGVDAVRHATRDELRKGAHHIKLMLSGGVVSPTDRIDSIQYSVPEIAAAVEEAEAANRYVTAHAYTAKAVNRALTAGVRGIEHGNLLDDESLHLFHDKDAYLTMTLVTHWALEREGRDFGLSQESWEKTAHVLNAGYETLGRAHEAGINLAFGTDLLGGMHDLQGMEFTIRGKVLPPIDVIRSATTVAAALLQREGQLGVIAPNAFGDFVITQDDPLLDLDVLASGRFAYVIQNGEIVRIPEDKQATNLNSGKIS